MELTFSIKCVAYPLVLATTLIACQPSFERSNSTIDAEIENLLSDREKEEYLEEILTRDKSVRAGSSSVLLQYGKNSEEYFEHYREMAAVDAENLVKIEHYLQIHGYPKKGVLSPAACTAPWIVIHHSVDVESRERNFEVLYRAYLSGDLDNDAMSFYLGRLYEKKNGDRHRMKSPYKPADQINELIDGVGLTKRKVQVQKSLAL